MRPMVSSVTSLPACSSIKFFAALITFTLNVPHSPRSDETTTSITLLAGRSRNRGSEKSYDEVHRALIMVYILST